MGAMVSVVLEVVMVMAALVVSALGLPGPTVSCPTACPNKALIWGWAKQCLILGRFVAKKRTLSLRAWSVSTVCMSPVQPFAQTRL